MDSTGKEIIKDREESQKERKKKREEGIESGRAPWLDLNGR